MKSTEISFYLIENPVSQGKLALSCRLAGKAYRLGLSVYIHTPDNEMSVKLDNMLWTLDQSSFIPHCQLGQIESGGDPYPVAIGEQQPPESWNSVLISLLDEVPPYYPRFARVIELVDHDEPDRALGRNRFRDYRKNGHQPATHHINL